MFQGLSVSASLLIRLNFGPVLEETDAGQRVSSLVPDAIDPQLTSGGIGQQSAGCEMAIIPPG